MGTCYNRLGEAVLTSTHNLYLEQKYENYQNRSCEVFIFGAKILNIFELACFRNVLVLFMVGFSVGQKYD